MRDISSGAHTEIDIPRKGDVEFLDVWDEAYASIMRYARATDGFWVCISLAHYLLLTDSFYSIETLISIPELWRIIMWIHCPLSGLDYRYWQETCKMPSNHI